MRVLAKDSDAVLVSLIAFTADAVRAILALQDGDACAIAGRAKLSSWMTKDGEEKRGLSVTADRALTAYQPAYVGRAFRRYLECSILAEGLGRTRNAEFGHDFLISFSAPSFIAA